MDHSKTEHSKINLLFLSIPISGLAALLRYRDFYKALEFVLLLFIVCIMTMLYLYIAQEKRKPFSITKLSIFGFVVISLSALIADMTHINLVFLFGISLLAVCSEIEFSLLSLISYAFLITLLGIGTQEYTILSLLSAIFILILTKFFYDFTSLVYVITSILSLNIVSLLILNNFNLSVIINQEKIIDIGIITVSVVFSYILFQFKQKNLTEEEEEEEAKNEISSSLIIAEETNEVISPSNLSSVEKESTSEISVESSAKEDVEEEKEDIEEEKMSENPSLKNLPKEIDYKVLLSEETFLYVLVKSNQALFASSLRRAKLCSEIAEMIGANSDLSAAGAFYSDCGKLNSSNYIKDSLNLIKQYGLPNEILQIVKEHHFKFGKPSTKEAAIVMILFRLEGSLAFFQSRGKKFPISHVINNVTDSLLMSGKFDQSGLGIHEYKFIKDYLIEEAPKEYDYFN